MAKVNKKEKLQQVFKSHLSSGKTAMGKKEFTTLFGETFGQKLTVEEVDRLLDEWDENRSGEIDEHEFIGLVSRLVSMHRVDWLLYCAFKEITGGKTTGKDKTSALDSSFVLDTCGAGSTLPRSSDEGFGILMVTTGSRVDRGSTAVSASGGEYCLCLCTMECDLQLKQLVRKEKKSPIQHFLNQCSTTTRLCTLVTKATQQMKVPGLQTPSGIRDARNQV